MNKFAALTQYLIGLNLVASESIESEVVEAQERGIYQFRGTGGFILSECLYTAEIYIERFPFTVYPVELVRAHILTWLATHDPFRDRDREEPDPTWASVVLTDTEADITFTIVFKDVLEIVEDENGTIEFMESLWSLAPVVPAVAETGEITGAEVL